MLERNCAVLLKEVDKEGKYRHNDQGRIVRVYDKQPTLQHVSGSRESIPSSVDGDGFVAVRHHGRGRGTRGRHAYRGQQMRGAGVSRGPGERSSNRGGRSKYPYQHRGDRRHSPSNFHDPPNQLDSAPKLHVSERALEALSRKRVQDRAKMDTTPAPENQTTDGSSDTY